MKLFTPKIPSSYCTGTDNARRLYDNRLTPILPWERDVTLSCMFERERYIPNLTLYGGRLSALDLDNCLYCTFEGVTIDADASRYGIRVADNSNAISLDSVIFEMPARRAEIRIGHRPGSHPASNWHGCGQVILRDVRREDGKPVRVEVWDAPLPILQNSVCDIRVMNPRWVRAAKWLHKKNLLP